MLGFNAGIKEFSNINYNEKGQQLSETNIGNILKAFNLKGLSDEELYGEIEKEINLDLDSPEFITHINKLYKSAINTYRNAFLINLKKPFSNTEFKNKEDFLKFLKFSANSGSVDRRQIYCDLIKIMFCYNQVEIHPEMKFAEDNLADFISDNYLNTPMLGLGHFELDISNLINGKKEGKNYYETHGTYNKKMPGGGHKIMKCKLRYRGKSAEKMVLKMLGSEKGASNILEIVNDSMGIELEAETKEESIYLLEYQYYTHAKQGNINQTDFRQKPDFYDKEDIKKFLKNPNLTKDFKEFLKEKLDEKIKKHGTNKYKDCKFQGTVETRNGCSNGLESRVVLKGNKNQSGMSASEIIDGKKVIDAMIGSRGFVFDSFVKRIAKGVSNYGGIFKSEEDIENLYMEKLVKVNIPGNKRNIYSSEWRLEDVIKNASDYPDFIVNAFRKFKNLKGSIEQVKNIVKRKTEFVF